VTPIFVLLDLDFPIH